MGRTGQQGKERKIIVTEERSTNRKLNLWVFFFLRNKLLFLKHEQLLYFQLNFKDVSNILAL